MTTASHRELTHDITSTFRKVLDEIVPTLTIMTIAIRSGVGSYEYWNAASRACLGINSARGMWNLEFSVPRSMPCVLETKTYRQQMRNVEPSTHEKPGVLFSAAASHRITASVRAQNFLHPAT